MTTKKDRSAKKIGDPINRAFKLEQSPFYAMTQAHGRYTLAMERSLKAIGMDLPRWRVLMVLHENNPSTISEISNRSVMKLSTMTKVAQRLSKEGYLRIAPNDSDRRVTDVHLLPKGEAAVEKIRSVASQVYRCSTEEFSDQEIETLVEMLNRLTASLEASA